MTDIISIYHRGRTGLSINIYDFLPDEEYVRISTIGNRLEIGRVGIDWVGKVLKIGEAQGSRRVSHRAGLPLGTYKIDQEESNEDQIVVYFDNPIN